MNGAYDSNIVPVVQNLFGAMFDFSVYGLGYELKDFYPVFLESKYCMKVEKADSSTVMGKSGVELCYDITGQEYIGEKRMDEFTNHAISGRSREYWTGWAVAYYQWKTSLSFKEIDALRGIDDIALMYDVYHEMDISQFFDQMNEVYRMKNPDTRLKMMRLNARLSQRELSEITQIPVKTIQQYEQRRKNINNASVDYLISLSKALNCDIELLIEKIF